MTDAHAREPSFGGGRLDETTTAHSGLPAVTQVVRVPLPSQCVNTSAPSVAVAPDHVTRCAFGLCLCGRDGGRRPALLGYDADRNQYAQGWPDRKLPNPTLARRRASFRAAVGAVEPAGRGARSRASADYAHHCGLRRRVRRA